MGGKQLTSQVQLESHGTTSRTSPHDYCDLRSTKIVKEPGNRPGDDSGAAGGSKVRRNEVSPFRDWTERDMAAQGKYGAE